jgi:Ca2+-dependent lipid-binding protein
MSNTLQVTIVEGRDLKDKDFLRKDDAFVEIYLDKDYKQRTTVVKDTDNPTWNETFILYVYLS